MILMDFEDLDSRCLKHGGGFSKLRGQLEPTELVHGHHKISTRRWLDLVPIDL